jgi:hypothetical protein
MPTAAPQRLAEDTADYAFEEGSGGFVPIF